MAIDCIHRQWYHNR